jgi:hypothetical protein
MLSYHKRSHLITNCHIAVYSMANTIPHHPRTRWQTTLRSCAIADSINVMKRSNLDGEIHDRTQFLINRHHGPTLIEYKFTVPPNMLALKLITLLITVSTGLKAVPFGEIRSAQTFFSSPSLSTSPAPLSTLINTDSFLHNDTKEEHTPSETLIDKDELESQPQLDDHADQDEGFDMNRHFHNKDGDDWGLYVPINLEGSKTIVRRAVGLEKRATARGTVHLDCKNAPEVCKNAGCYQNCLRKAKGNNKSFYYTNGPLEITKNARGRTLTPQANENRFNSGVALSWSRPCRAWPFAQKFWHPQDFKGLGPELDLETDEWPMATMRTGI